MLRQFLYLDESLTSQFLSQLEGGLYNEEAQTWKTTSGSNLEGGIGVGPLRGSGARRSADEEAVSRTMRQTAESAFQRLVTLLQDADDLHFVEALDDGSWKDLARGQVVEIDTAIHLPAITHMLGAAASLGPLLDVVKALGSDVDDADAEGLAAMMSFANTTKTVPVVATAVGSDSYRFIAHLDRSSLTVDAHELEGEATVVAKVRRKLTDGERYMVFEFFAGQNSLPRKLRRELETSFAASAEDDDFGEDLFVTSPAAIVTPIAVYR